MSTATETQGAKAAPVPAGRSAILADLARDRDNNFNMIRVMLAGMVLVHHAFVLTGNRIEPTNVLMRVIEHFGSIGVDGFFLVSGFLVTRSMINRNDVVAFAAARILRIYPGLICMLLLTTGALTFLTTLSPADYLTHRQTLTYLVSNATAFFIQFNLPGLFTDQPNNAVNGSLWSLRYELLCYVGVAITGLTGLARRRWIFPLGVLLCAALFPLAGDDPNYFVGLFRRLGLMFGLGAVAAAYAHRLPMRWWIAAGLYLLAFGLDLTPFAPIGWAVAWAYALLWFAYVPRGVIRQWNRLPDISYGLYIYAFPVQQSLISTGVGTTPLSNGLWAAAIVATLATISWYTIEKPALAFKDHFGRQRDPRVKEGATQTST